MKRWLVSILLLWLLGFMLGLVGCEVGVPLPDESDPNVPSNNHENDHPDQDLPNQEEKNEQILRINWGTNPPKLDPQRVSDQLSGWILNAVMEGLIRMNPDGSYGMGLAESYHLSDDKTVYTFTLREAYWSNGRRIIAQDFYDAWMRAINPIESSPYAQQFYHILGASQYHNSEIQDKDLVGIKVIDEKTLEVTLVQPTPYFLNLTAFVSFMPISPQALEDFGAEYGTTHEYKFYSGPFIIEQWVPERILVLAKNPNYHDANQVQLDKIYGYMIQENDVLSRMYDRGELDLMQVPIEFLDKYRFSPEYQTLSEATTWFLMFNLENEYFSNLKIRRAFALATDQQAYLSVIAQNNGVVAEGMTPPSMAGKERSFASERFSVLPEYDPNKANMLFEEALEEMGKTKEDFAREVRLLSDTGDTWNRRAQFFQSQWKENLDIELVISQRSFTNRLQSYQSGAYQIAFVGWGGDFNDPLTFLDIFSSDNGHNFTRWENSEYDAHVLAAIKGERNERMDALVRAEGILARELPIYPIYHPNKSMMIKPYVRSLAIFPVGSDYDFKWTYIDRSKDK